jgi:hypothetical protein
MNTSPTTRTLLLKSGKVKNTGKDTGTSRVVIPGFDHAGDSASELVVLPTNITKGIYHVQVKGAMMVLNNTLLID